MAESLRLLWTTRQLADAAGISRTAIWGIIRRLGHGLGPAKYTTRNGHPRRHRQFDEYEAALIVAALRNPVKPPRRKSE